MKTETKIDLDLLSPNERIAFSEFEQSAMRCGLEFQRARAFAYATVMAAREEMREQRRANMGASVAFNYQGAASVCVAHGSLHHDRQLSEYWYSAVAS